MSVRNVLLLAGIIAGLLLVSLRVWGQFNAPSNDLRMFTEALGYGDAQRYAVFLLDPEKEPLLFVFTVKNGEVELVSVASSEHILKNLYKQNLAEAAGVLVERIQFLEMGAVDAVGFVTVDAARKLVDAFGGFYIYDAQIGSGNLPDILWKFAESEDAMQELADAVYVSKYTLMTQGGSVLQALKDVFGKRLVAVYFSDSSKFGKPCFGACGTELFEYFPPNANVNR